MKQNFTVTGMTCAACQSNVSRTVSALTGVKDVDVNLLSGRMAVEFDETALSAETIAEAVCKIGYGATADKPKKVGESGTFRKAWTERKDRAAAERTGMKRRLFASLALLIPLMYVSMGHMVGLPLPRAFMENGAILAFTQLLLTAPVLFINRKFFTVGLRALFHRAPNMDSLVAIGSGASFLYGIFVIYRMLLALGEGDGATVAHFAHQLYFESAAMILTLVTLGKFLEARSKDKTAASLEKLMDLAPKTANVLRDGAEITIPAEELRVGDTVIVRPGQTLPADGVILWGNGTLDQSPITGESVPVDLSVGDEVISATVNRSGVFHFRATRVGEETTLSKIIRLVDEAGSTKAPIATMADKISGVFVPVVIGISLLTFAIWMLLAEGFEFALSAAISVLVISCPCALGLATPVAIMVGTGVAAEHGILVKSAEALELLSRVDTVILDKTGTITAGHPAVTDVIPAEGITPAELLTVAAAVEAGSEHPLALAVMERAKAEGISPPPSEDFTAYGGRGVSAVVDGVLCAGGNSPYIIELLDDPIAARPILETMEERAASLAEMGKTPLFFIKDKKFLGILAVADTVRADSRVAIDLLQREGKQVIMLTGDNEITARATAKEVGIQQVIAWVRPADKDYYVKQQLSKGRTVAMIGDGINDAPALMRADVGIAIGGGTDVAMESADVVLMKNSLTDAVNAMALGRKVVKNIKMNLFWAFFYNVLGIPVAAGVLYLPFAITLSPMIGAAAMSLSSVFVVTNALRLRLFRPKMAAITPEPENQRNDITEKETVTMKTTLKIDGMMCNHCRMHVEKALSAVEGVSAVTVDLEAKTATVESSAEISRDTLRAVVADAGYTPLD